MWWFVVPIIGIVGKIIYDTVSDDDQIAPAQNKTTLELNLQRLEKLLPSQSGYKVALLGQPGAGKSSLLKKMTNNKVKPKPNIGIETDATSWSADENCNLFSVYEKISFVDVPGYDTKDHPVDSFILNFPFDYFDSFIFVIRGKIRSADEDIFRLIAKSGKKQTVAISHSDGLEATDISIFENDIRARLSIPTSTPVVFFSNKNGDGVSLVFELI